MSVYDNGRPGEKLIRELLKHDGWAVYDINDPGVDGAPLLHLPNGEKRVLPDLLAFRGSKMVFVEAKTKFDGPEYIYKAGENQHCVDRRPYDDYCEVAEKTEFSVYICLYEEPNEWRNVLCKNVDELEPAPLLNKKHDKKYKGKQQVFFSREDFDSVDADSVVWFEDEAYVDDEPIDKADKGLLPIEPSGSDTGDEWGRPPEGEAIQTDLNGQYSLGDD